MKKERLDKGCLFWGLCGCFILTMVITGFVIKDTLECSRYNNMIEWIKIGILSHKNFLPGLLVPIFAIGLGSILGILSSSIIGKGRIGSVVNFLSVCLVDVLESLPKYPTILLGILLIPQYYYHKLLWIMAILGILNSAKISRIVKAKVDCLEKTDFIEAAKSFGISKWRLCIFHILISNCLLIFIIQASFQMIDVILIEIGFAYISSLTDWGRSSTPTFGNMLVFAINNNNQSIVWLLSSGLVVFNILTFLNLPRIIDNWVTRRQGYGNLT